MQQDFVPWPSGQASLQADAFSVAASDSVSVYGHRHTEHQLSESDEEEEEEELIQVEPHGKENLKKKGALLDLTTELLGDDETVKPKVVDPKVGKLLTKHLSSTHPLETIRSLAQDYPGIESIPKAVVPSGTRVGASFRCRP